MIVVDLPMPKTCIECPVRMECQRYRDWILDVTDTTVPKPMFYRSCLIKKEEKK